MASNAPDPPGAQPNPNPHDDFYSPSKTQEIRPAVVATFSQDFPTQSTVQYTQVDVSQNTNYEELVAYHTTGPVSSLASERDARNDLSTQAPNTNNQKDEGRPFRGGIPPPTLSFTTGAAMVATPSYAPSPELMRAPTLTGDLSPSARSNAAQGTSLGESKAANVDDFITHIRFNPLPPDVANGAITMNECELQDLQYVTHNLKQEINNAYMGYSYYYTTNDIRMHPDRNVDIPEGDINAAHKMLVVALDAGFGAPRTTMPYKILTSTGWFRLVFSLMGAILRGAIRSDQFRKFGRDSLNGTSDHAIIQEGLPRPNRFGQLLSAMANQLATLADPDSHYPGDHHTKMYGEAVEIVSDKIQAALLAKAKQEVTAADEEAARNVVWTELVFNTKEELQANPEQKARVEAEVAKMIVTMLHTESQQTIDEWRAAWLEGLKAAIREEPFQPKASSPPQSQLLRENETEARVAIAARLQEVKQSFMQDIKKQVTSEQDESIQAEATQNYNRLVAERVTSLERSLAAQHEQRTTEAKARAAADIAQEVEPWKALEREHLRGLFSETAMYEASSNDTGLLKAAADKLGFDLVERSQPMKKQRTGPDAGHKRSRSGSRARRTPSPSENSQMDMDVTPTKMDRPERGRPLRVPPLEFTDNTEVTKLQHTADEVQRRKLAADQTAKASMHNPANQMTDDPEMQERAQGEALAKPIPGEAAASTASIPAKPDSALAAVLAGIHNLTSQFNSQFNALTTRLSSLEHKVEGAQRPSDPRLQWPPTQGAQTTAGPVRSQNPIAAPTPPPLPQYRPRKRRPPLKLKLNPRPRQRSWRAHGQHWGRVRQAARGLTPL